MRSIAYALPTLPGFAGPKTYAAWPVWRDSTISEVKYQAIPKRQAVQLFHKARRFERQTRQPGRQDGALGRNGLAVLHALLFDFLNYTSGRLDPSYAKIGEKACISARSVARGLVCLRAAGVLNWLRRCAESWRDGRFCLEQETNAYAVLPATQWRGYYELPEAPPPHPASWGAIPPLPDQLAQAVADRRAGAMPRRQLDDQTAIGHQNRIGQNNQTAICLVGKRDDGALDLRAVADASGDHLHCEHRRDRLGHAQERDADRVFRMH